MSEIQDVVCIVLAAGASSRFGSAKMLHRLSNGQCLLTKTLVQYSKVFSNVSVVARANDTGIVNLIQELGMSHIDSPHAEQGLSQSLIAGVRGVAAGKAWLIALGDMPYVQAQTIASIKQLASADNIVLPKSDQGKGNPIAIGVNFRDNLLALKGDVGARGVVTAYANRVHYVATNDLGIHHDIDVPGDI